MPVPYTREAIAQLRAAARTGTPAETVRQHFAWDAARFDSICRRHQIEFLRGMDGVPAADPMPEVVPIPKPAAPSSFNAITAKLTPRQTDLFRVLYENAGGYLTASQIALLLGLSRGGCVTDSMGGLRRRLERMRAKYHIGILKARGGGYRLLVDEGEQS